MITLLHPSLIIGNSDIMIYCLVVVLSIYRDLCEPLVTDSDIMINSLIISGPELKLWWEVLDWSTYHSAAEIKKIGIYA